MNVLAVVPKVLRINGLRVVLVGDNQQIIKTKPIETTRC